MCIRLFLLGYTFALLNLAILEAGTTRPVPVRKSADIIKFPTRAA